MNQPVAIVVADTGAAQHHFTAAEFRRMMDMGAFDGMSIELVGGNLWRMAPANPDHGRRQFDVAKQLDGVVTGTGLVVVVETALDVDGETVRAMDVALLRAGTASDRPLHGSDVVVAVEIAASTLHRDLGSKALDYARAGITHYWVVDTSAKAVHVMASPTSTGYAYRTIVRFGEALTVPETGATIVLD